MPFNLSNWDELIPLTRDRFQGGLVRVTPYDSRSLGNNMTGSRITIESPAHIYTAFTEYGAPLTTQTPWRDFASTALANENAG